MVASIAAEPVERELFGFLVPTKEIYWNAE